MLIVRSPLSLLFMPNSACPSGCDAPSRLTSELAAAPSCVYMSLRRDCSLQYLQAQRRLPEAVVFRARAD